MPVDTRGIITGALMATGASQYDDVTHSFKKRPGCITLHYEGISQPNLVTAAWRDNGEALQTLPWRS